MSRGEPTALVLLDLSAAFDTIDQPIKIGSIMSDLCKLLFVLSQERFLGPLLFSLYTIYLSSVIGKCKGINFHFYAYDTQGYVHLSQKHTSVTFEQLGRCLATSKLGLNPDKTEFIAFGSKRQRNKLKVYFPIVIFGTPLCPVESVKNLAL